MSVRVGRNSPDPKRNEDPAAATVRVLALLVILIVLGPERVAVPVLDQVAELVAGLG
jgi:hypothetical protein